MRNTAQKRKTGRPTKTPGQKETSEKIIQEAINLIAQNGYDNVTIRNIAAAVGIKESSIYKHYPSKEAILQKIIQYPLAKVYQIAARNDTTEQIITKLGVEGFMSDSGSVLTNWLSDPNTIKILRIFYIELYHNEQIKRSFNELITAGQSFWTMVFSIMIRKGFIKSTDPDVLAQEFLSFFWNTFTDYFLVRYGSTTESFTALYNDSFERHVSFFLKAVEA